MGRPSCSGSWRALPSGTECPAIGEVRTLDVTLDPPFSGSRVHDTVGGTVFTVDDLGPSSSSGATAVPSTPSATPVTGIVGVAWEASASATVDGTVHRITAEGDRFYALGSRHSATAEEAMVWSSADGRTWMASDPLPRPSWWTEEGVGFFYADELVKVGGRLVAIGSIGFADGLNAVAWESTDGRTWTAIDQGTFHADAYNINDVTSGPGGIVAISHGYVEGSGSAWRSTDGGRTWSEHRPPGPGVTTTAIVGIVSGYVLAGAVNESYDGTAESPRIWTSTDGTSWREASLDGSDGRGRIAQLTVDASGRWVALGLLDDRIVTWVSTGGQRWERTADLGPAIDNQWLSLIHI